MRVECRRAPHGRRSEAWGTRRNPKRLADEMKAGCRAGARRRTRLRSVGRGDEWHLPLVNPFRHLAFHLGAWLGQPAVVIAPPLLHTRLVAVGPVRDPMAGDGIRQLVVHAPAAGGVTRGPGLQ